MSRLVIPILLLLLFLASPVSAIYNVDLGGFLYEVRYSAISNGTSALINVDVDNYGVYCGMDSCSAEVYQDYQYLLFFNGSRLYLLNLTSLVLSTLPSYAPAPVSEVGFFFDEIHYINDSWHVNMNVFVYSKEMGDGVSLSYIYKLDTKNFCAESVNVSLAESPIIRRFSPLRDTINGWRIEIPEKFRAKYVFINGTWVQVGNKTEVRIPPSADFFLIANSSVANGSYSVPWLLSNQRPVIANWTQFPVYFVLKKDGQVKNVTILYINTTNTINGYWFPDSVRIVNVTICKRATNTPTSTTTGIETTPRSNATKTKTKGICGPGLIVLATSVVLLLRRHRN
ncbi:hypothetical protein APY94_04640 [Thermococcus celericrescens]|uniref:CGP-CTERM sorting domain-containing protein n=1 Tax=Thermococcus celericrescens TaxID=227598 RepID=A0A100XYN6_9EURY|nr:CGP-CTERM sorting domain-containing protein [Thermococcus celericrescens]KUH33814.1 hypothetical protein APY94_04640 [Thermococcus celericrescens]